VYTQANIVTVGDPITRSIPIKTDGRTASPVNGDRNIFQADVATPDATAYLATPQLPDTRFHGCSISVADSDSTGDARRFENHAFIVRIAGTYYVRG